MRTMRAMTNPPLHPAFPTLMLRAKTSGAHASPLPRATLDGLEVQESNFGQWLAAGGERRQRPRDEPAASGSSTA